MEGQPGAVILFHNGPHMAALFFAGTGRESVEFVFEAWAECSEFPAHNFPDKAGRIVHEFQQMGKLFLVGHGLSECGTPGTYAGVAADSSREMHNEENVLVRVRRRTHMFSGL